MRNAVKKICKDTIFYPKKANHCLQRQDKTEQQTKYQQLTKPSSWANKSHFLIKRIISYLLWDNN